MPEWLRWFPGEKEYPQTFLNISLPVLLTEITFPHWVIIAMRLLWAGDAEKKVKDGPSHSAAHCRVRSALPAPQTRGEAFKRSGVKTHLHT